MEKITRLLTLLLSAVIILTICVSATSDSTYSMNDDPLVSKSYVDNLKKEIVTELAKSIDQDCLYDYIQTSTFNVVTLKLGQKIVATGSCEIVLRSGSAKIIITSPDNLKYGIGFSDLTGAAEIANGGAAPRNHLLLASAGDGRIIEATSNTAYFMVRGDYTVVG